MTHKTEALNGLTQLEEKIEGNRSPSEILTEHQRVVEETKDLPEGAVGHIYDQKTYDLFRYGLSLREAIEAAQADKRAKPDDIDFVNAKDAIETSQNRGLFNQGAFDHRIAKVAAAHGEDFDPNSPIGDIDDVETADQFAAVLAGLFAAGNLPTTEGRRQLIDGVNPKSHFISKLSDIYYGLAEMDEKSKNLALKFVPSVGGLHDKVRQLVETNGVDFFRDLDTTRGDAYFKSITASRNEKNIADAEAAVENAFAPPIFDHAIEASQRIVENKTEESEPLDPRHKLIFAPLERSEGEDLPISYDFLFSEDYEPGSVQDAATKEVPERFKLDEKYVPVHLDFLRNKITPNSDLAIAIFGDSAGSPQITREVLDRIRYDESTRVKIGECLLARLNQRIREGIKYGRRIHENSQKNLHDAGTGYEHLRNVVVRSREYAALLALSMLDGSFDGRRSSTGDGIVTNDKGEVVRGQHRDAAYDIL